MCKDGQTFGHGVIREVSSDTFLLVCDIDFELSSKNSDKVKCLDGFVVVKESPKCREMSFSPTIRKIRTTFVEREKRSVDKNEDRPEKRRRHNNNDDSVRRSNRRKNQRRRKHQNNNNNSKHVFQADEGAASVPGEAVQWRSYGNDVVGKVNLKFGKKQFHATHVKIINWRFLHFFLHIIQFFQHFPNFCTFS